MSRSIFSTADGEIQKSTHQNVEWLRRCEGFSTLLPLVLGETRQRRVEFTKEKQTKTIHHPAATCPGGDKGEKDRVHKGKTIQGQLSQRTVMGSAPNIMAHTKMVGTAAKNQRLGRILDEPRFHGKNTKDHQRRLARRRHDADSRTRHGVVCISWRSGSRFFILKPGQHERQDVYITIEQLYRTTPGSNCVNRYTRTRGYHEMP